MKSKLGVLAILVCVAAADLHARSTLDLNGTWEFRTDPTAVGDDENWASSNAPFPSRIEIPAAWETQGVGEREGILRTRYSGVAWYSKSVMIPSDWRGKVVKLKVGGVVRRAVVFVNGQRLGEHYGFSTPFSFDITKYTARSEGAELVLDVRQLERIGISGRFQYALQKTYFYGPITGGFAGDEPLTAGERIIPAFDQTHTGTAQVFYHSRWQGFWTGSALRYGSGTIIEGGNRLPQHFTADLASGMTLWNPEPMRLDVEFDVTNVSDNVYQIAKESEEIPIQYSPPRTVGGSLKFNF